MSKFERNEKARWRYVSEKPRISTERAEIWTKSYQQTEGEPTPIRAAKAFRDTCEQIGCYIFEDELIVGAVGEFFKCGILTPEFSWKWVNEEMDTFSYRPQDPYVMTPEQCEFVRREIFPYWKGKSLEEAFLARLPRETAAICVDTGIADSDSKWRQAVGETTPDYQDQLFPKGFGGIKREAETRLAALDNTSKESQEKRDFYRSIIITSEGIITLAHRYGEKARQLAAAEPSPRRKTELLRIAEICSYVPENPPRTFYEAIQFVWFVQWGGIISENPLSLNPGRFDQYMYPYYQADLDAGRITPEEAQELIEALWIKYSTWVWTISSNTAGYFAGYNQFQNLTVGGKKSDGTDGTNAISYMALKATEEVKTHQPGLSVRISQSCPRDFLDAVTHLIAQGTGFPAIHSDECGYKMLLENGMPPKVAMDWNNCGCVVPHNRKASEWTAAANLNFGTALECAMNQGVQRMTGAMVGLPEKKATEFTSYEELEQAYYKQLSNIIRHTAIATIEAQRLHEIMVPRPFLSSLHEHCMESGRDLANGGGRYNVGPVMTGIGLGCMSDALAVIKKLVFEEKKVSMQTLCDALAANWEGYEELRQQARSCPKFGNDDDYVDSIAVKMANFYYDEVHRYLDCNGKPFLSAFMGISNYIPTGRVVGATPDGRKAGEPLTEGVSPYAGSDKRTPIAAMRSAAKITHDIHSGGTLLNMRLGKELVETRRGQANLGALLLSYFALGAFHVQFNIVSNEILRDAQKHPENYKDLLVRVAGYSTQWVNLSREMQEAIIARNEHTSY
ncbi:MAG: pyruvate formate lyase family protein [Lachnospiraceae bacterium]|nr:pyruvate formate lyase family protein [Lachnospiraceae bacterium]